jgi:hypothetical protein
LVYTQDFNPVGDSLGLTAIFAALPLIRRRPRRGVFAFLSALIGWLGVAVTGSDTSSNALFGALQVTAANDAGISETLLAAANSSGGCSAR